MKICKIDPNGTISLKLYKNASGQQIYMISEENVPDGFTFVANERASSCSRNASLQIFSLPLSSPSSDELTFQEFEFYSFYRNFDSFIEFYKTARVDLPVAPLPIVVSSNGKLEVFLKLVFCPFLDSLFVRPAAQNYDTQPVWNSKFHVFQAFEDKISSLEIENTTIHVFNRTQVTCPDGSFL